jgi:uncharacterized membrane protein YkoI
MIRVLIPLLTAAIMAIAAPGYADDDHDRARAALDAGEIAPLAQILSAVERDLQGEVIEVELEREHDMWIYEVKLLTPTGSVLAAKYDARAATLLRVRGRDADAARRH